MTIGPFKGDYRWLSNFWDTPISFNGQIYDTTEHFYQSFKTDDYDARELIVNAETPNRAKRLGAKAPIREDWEDIKKAVMLQATLLKFTQHPEMHQKLMETGETMIVEFNGWHDNFWGVCFCEKCGSALGENNLGLIIMHVRAVLQHKHINPMLLVALPRPEDNQPSLF